MPNKIWDVDNIGLTITELHYRIATLGKDEKIDIHNVSMENLLFMLKAFDLYSKISGELKMIIENLQRIKNGR